MTRINRFALLLALAMTVVACGDDDAGGTSTTAGGVTTTAGGGTTTTAGSGTITTAGANVVDPIDLDDLSIYLEPEGLSYRTTLAFTFFTDTPTTVQGRLDADGGHVLGPPEEVDLIARGEGAATVPGGCFLFGSNPSFVNPYDTFLEDGGMLMGEASLLTAGLTVGDRTVDRYRVTIDNIDPTDDAGSEVDELTDGYVDIDREGRFVVTLYLLGRGRSELLTGSTTLVGDVEYNLVYSEFGTITEMPTLEGC